LTNEHVFARWITRALAGTGPINLRASLADGQQWTVRSRAEIDDKIKRVCASCNHGWSHDLERAFRALMLPALTATGDVRLGPGSQQVVATWATKAWLLGELTYSQLRGGNVENPGTLRRLRDVGVPPTSSQVWLGAVSRLDRTMTSLAHLAVRTSRGHIIGWLGVLTVGHILLVLYGPTIPLAGSPTYPISLNVEGLAQVWPHEVEEVRWPTSRVYTAKQIEAMWPPGAVITIGN
jgi:hypothetical protein